METLIRKLSLLRQEIINNKRNMNDILNDMDTVIVEMENLIDCSNDNIRPNIFKHDTYLTSKDFDICVKNNENKNSFKEAVEPAIRYLLENCNPHSKIYIDNN